MCKEEDAGGHRIEVSLKQEFLIAKKIIGATGTFLPVLRGAGGGC
jgi:hypothetical protein